MNTIKFGDSPTPEDREKLLTVSQFAKQINRHPATVRTMLQKGLLQGFKINGTKSVLIPESQLKEILIPLGGDGE
jgi:excisionase family DNA binding protein